MRKKIAAGNWKMNLSLTEAQKLVSEIAHIYEDEYMGEAEVIFGVPFPYLHAVHHLIKGKKGISLAAQNMHQADGGAYTGETSAQMLKEVGVSHVILGHSERRQYFGEAEALLAAKTDKALENDLEVIFCIGESLEERENSKTLDVVKHQLTGGCFHLSAEDFGKLTIAYEPVWAIGTGKTATPEQAQEVHAYIRQLIADKYTQAVADDCTILYGGSVKPTNAQELFAQADLDGGLVGGASLKTRDFVDIIKAL
jgi:triosephosphate isomerase